MEIIIIWLLLIFAFSHQIIPPIKFTTTAAIHAILHCSNITSNAHFPPSSRFIDAIAATHGVYKRQNTRSAIAFTGDMIPSKNDVFGISTESVDTTLSLAINPQMRAVHIRQSPNPAGENTGAIMPAIYASRQIRQVKRQER